MQSRTAASIDTKARQGTALRVCVQQWWVYLLLQLMVEWGNHMPCFVQHWCYGVHKHLKSPLLHKLQQYICTAQPAQLGLFCPHTPQNSCNAQYAFDTL